MDFFIKNKIVILRSLGAIMLIVGFAVHFWATPKKGVSANERAAANVARMEAKVAGNRPSSQKSSKKDDSSFLKELKKTQAKQLQYLTILAMLLGLGFVGYTFIPRKEK